MVPALLLVVLGCDALFGGYLLIHAVQFDSGYEIRIYEDSFPDGPYPVNFYEVYKDGSMVIPMESLGVNALNAADLAFGEVDDLIYATGVNQEATRVYMIYRMSDHESWPFTGETETVFHSIQRGEALLSELRTLLDNDDLTR